jgi:hypothetical protein
MPSFICSLNTSTITRELLITTPAKPMMPNGKGYVWLNIVFDNTFQDLSVIKNF